MHRGTTAYLHRQQVVFGPLPANNYTYEVYWQGDGGEPQLGIQQPLVVTPAPSIPALSRLALALLAAALLSVALLTLGRMTP